ncbi:hypothetical protein B0H15DRAFT_806673 [Mycena belliarum]|uniref:Ribonuclease H1 N-terminal domain-containing protein n=1 Tax=Mycena belliarum TaxID=1033014 RepID=A0AAD6XH21_9AGAR|nr:hypothetical protein B0H15DRAFT_807481 [Mycena belliae]KAJ7073556.1 hypothetical protein B0H15DRAFT_806673 [Mycena belliae]
MCMLRPRDVWPCNQGRYPRCQMNPDLDSPQGTSLINQSSPNPFSMAPYPATTTATPEMAALVAQISTLSKLALDMTKHCITLNESIPAVVAAQVDAILNPPSSPKFAEARALTPDELATRFPPGQGETQTYYVVCVGRQPGLYTSADDATAQISGVPNYIREKKKGRLEALNFYRTLYNRREVHKLVDVIPDD